MLTIALWKFGTLSRLQLPKWEFILSHFPTLRETWNVTPSLHTWPAPSQALALVTSPRQGLQHINHINMTTSSCCLGSNPSRILLWTFFGFHRPQHTHQTFKFPNTQTFWDITKWITTLHLHFHISFPHETFKPLLFKLHILKVLVDFSLLILHMFMSILPTPKLQIPTFWHPTWRQQFMNHIPNQGCQNQRDATILHRASHQHFPSRICWIYQNWRIISFNDT
jgi:hypothetical protein